MIVIKELVILYLLYYYIVNKIKNFWNVDIILFKIMKLYLKYENVIIGFLIILLYFKKGYIISKFVLR